MSAFGPSILHACKNGSTGSNSTHPARSYQPFRSVVTRKATIRSTRCAQIIALMSARACGMRGPHGYPHFLRELIKERTNELIDGLKGGGRSVMRGFCLPPFPNIFPSVYFSIHHIYGRHYALLPILNLPIDPADRIQATVGAVRVVGQLSDDRQGRVSSVCRCRQETKQGPIFNEADADARQHTPPHPRAPAPTAGDMDPPSF